MQVKKIKTGGSNSVLSADPPIIFIQFTMEGRMKAKKMTFGGLFGILLIVALLISCGDGTPTLLPLIQAPIGNEVMQPPAKPPSKYLGTPGLLGTLPWIHDFIDKIKIKFIPCHYFGLGSPDCNPLSNGNKNQETRVKMPGYFMFEGQVTNGQYAACEESGVCTPLQTSDQGPCSRYRNSNFADMPVVCVNWYQANTFCQWAEGKLPSQAQWEAGTCGSDGKPKPSGNLREWLNDWYQPGIQKISLFNPSGPLEGKLKLVSGGGVNDPAFAPDTTHEDVGFRCVPTPTEYAPFCPSQITELCSDPNIPTSEKPCTPGTQETGGGKTSINSFGCPANGQVSIVFDTNGGGNSGYAVVVGDQKYPCVPYTGPDLIKCSIPEQHMGSTISLTVCGGGGGQTVPTPIPASDTQNASGGIILASLAKSDPLNVRLMIIHNCPAGYIWQDTQNPATGANGACVRDPNADCPQGWFMSALLNCQPTNDQSCPPGTKMNRDAGGCVPDKDCPDGYLLTERKTCEPEQNDRKLCPAGYYFDKTVQCCQPIRGNNYKCDANHYFDPNYKRCMPIDGNGCGFNFISDCYGRCLRNPYQDPQSPRDGQCPGNLTFAAANICNTPPNGANDEKPDPLRMVLPGDTRTADGFVVVGDSGHDCGQGATFLAAANGCVSRDKNGCPYAYHFSDSAKYCIPDYGPGSYCPLGTKFQSRLGCCAPIPGYDGSRCPQDGQTAAAANLDTSDPLQVYRLTIYDPLQGACDPGTSQDGQTPQCPPGYPSTNNQPCTFDEGTAALMMTANGKQIPTFTALNCPPGYWDQQKQTCSYKPPECPGTNEYFDYILGFCVHLNSDCCQLGQSFSALLKRCAPDRVNPSPEGKCADGYEMVDGRCLLIGRSEGGQCTTISVNVPTCFGPCKVGQTYNKATGQCEKPKQDQCANVNCGNYSMNNCPGNCCKVDSSTYRCVKK